MRKKISALLPAVLCTILLSGCSHSDQTGGEVLSEAAPPKVQLTVWGAEEDQDLLKQIVSDFQKEHQGEADLRITLTAQSESACKDMYRRPAQNRNPPHGAAAR